jgi:spermidine synthase
VKKTIGQIVKYFDRFAATKLIEKGNSAFSPGLEVVRSGDSMILNSSNTNYSFGGLHKVFQKVFQELKIDKHEIKDVLILGFGAGSVASILLEEYKIPCRITGIEIDPEVIRLGQTFFSTASLDKVKIIEADALEYIQTETKNYDLIVVDVYVDINVPESCESMPFLRTLEACLKPGGMLLFNKLIYNNEAAKQAKELEKKFGNLAGEMKVLKIREKLVNKVLVFEKK